MDDPVATYARRTMAEARTAFPDAQPGALRACGLAPSLAPLAAGAAAPDRDHWIEVVLVDDDDRPVEGAQWKVVASDGRVFTGTLDETGSALVTGLAPGPATISFPSLDRRVWSPA